MRVDALVAGRYRLAELLGAGGMGEVWRATDEVLRRSVAVKVVLPSLHADPEFGRRFLAEARAMASVRHPGVVAIHDFGETDDPDARQHNGTGKAAFMVMEYVPGESLSAMLRRQGRLSPSTTMDLIAQAAQALQAVHDCGIVHRDVKPANLIVRRDGTIALADFGIAAGHTTTSLTAPGMILGTLSYLAPEQVLGKPATARSDVYALGLVAYECLTGQRPFIAEDPVAAALLRVHQPAPPLPDDVPSPVAQVLSLALATDPADRWQTAGELAHAAKQALTRFGTGSAPGIVSTSDASPETPEQKPPAAGSAGRRGRRRAPAGGPVWWRRRRRLAVAAAAVVVLITAGTVTLWATTLDRSPAADPNLGQQGQQGKESGLPISDALANASTIPTASGVPPTGLGGSTPGPNPGPGQSAGAPTGTSPRPAPAPTTPAGQRHCQTWVYPTYTKVSGSNDSKPSFGLLACTKISGNQVYGGFEYQSNSSAATIGGGYSFKVSMLLRNCESPNEHRADTVQQASGTISAQGSWWYRFPWPPEAAR